MCGGEQGALQLAFVTFTGFVSFFKLLVILISI
jgi:hypothetical protein